MNPYILSLVVTCEQEQAIGALFHHREWNFTKIGFRPAYKEELDLYYKTTPVGGKTVEADRGNGPNYPGESQHVYGSFTNLMQSPFGLYSGSTLQASDQVRTDTNITGKYNERSNVGDINASKPAHECKVNHPPEMSSDAVNEDKEIVIKPLYLPTATSYSVVTNTEYGATQPINARSNLSFGFFQQPTLSNLPAPPSLLPMSTAPCSNQQQRYSAIQSNDDFNNDLIIDLDADNSKPSESQVCVPDKNVVDEQLAEIEKTTETINTVSRVKEVPESQIDNLVKEIKMFVENRDFDIRELSLKNINLVEEVRKLFKRLVAGNSGVKAFEQIGEQKEFDLGDDVSKTQTVDQLTSEQNVKQIEDEFVDESNDMPATRELKRKYEDNSEVIEQKISKTETFIIPEMTREALELVQSEDMSADASNNIEEENEPIKNEEAEVSIADDGDLTKQVELEKPITHKRHVLRNGKNRVARGTRKSASEVNDMKHKQSTKQKLLSKCDRFGINRSRRLHSFHRRCHATPNDLDGDFYSASENGYYCPDCKFIFFKKNKLLYHKKMKNQGKCLSECIYCDAEENKEVFQCLLCPKVFESRELLDRHMEKHTHEVYNCAFCLTGFCTIPDLKFHMQQEHKEQITQTFLCDLCGSEFKEKKVLVAHRKYVHTNERPEICQTCGRKFKTKSQLKNHFLTHIAPSDANLSCEICGKMFVRVGTLKEHVRRHKKEYSFFCEVCKKGFYKKHGLDEHMRIHTGDKPYSCNLCEFKSALSCNLQKHMKTHQRQAGFNNLS